MHSTIENCAPQLPPILRKALPSRLLAELQESAWGYAAQIEEIHLRRGCASSLIISGENRRLRCVLNGAEMDATLLALCDGSLYAHGETLCQGFLRAHGLRVGVCGRANVVGNAWSAFARSAHLPFVCPIKRRPSARRSVSCCKHARVACCFLRPPPWEKQLCFAPLRLVWRGAPRRGA